MSDEEFYKANAIPALSRAGVFEIASQLGLTMNQAAARFFRSFGAVEVVLTSDDALLFVEDAPAVEYPDGTALDKYGCLIDK